MNCSKYLECSQQKNTKKTLEMRMLDPSVRQFFKISFYRLLAAIATNIKQQQVKKDHPKMLEKITEVETRVH